MLQNVWCSFESHPIIFSHHSPRASESLVNSARVNYPVFPIYSLLWSHVLAWFAPAFLFPCSCSRQPCSTSVPVNYVLTRCFVAFPLWLSPSQCLYPAGLLLLGLPFVIGASAVLQLCTRSSWAGRDHFEAELSRSPQRILLWSLSS